MWMLTKLSVVPLIILVLLSVGCTMKRNIQLIPDEREVRPGYTNCVLANDDSYVCKKNEGYVTISRGFLRDLLVLLKECGHGVDGILLSATDEEIRPVTQAKTKPGWEHLVCGEEVRSRIYLFDYTNGQTETGRVCEEQGRLYVCGRNPEEPVGAPRFNRVESSGYVADGQEWMVR